MTDMADPADSELMRSAGELARLAAAEPGGSDWTEAVSAEMHRLRTSLSEHIHAVELEHGVLDEIVETKPALAAEVAAVRDDHGELCEAVDLALDLASGIDPAGVEGHEARLREMLTDLAEHVTRHHERITVLIPVES